MGKYQGWAITIGLIAVALAFVVEPVVGFVSGIFPSASATEKKWLILVASGAAIFATLLVGKMVFKGKEAI